MNIFRKLAVHAAVGFALGIATHAFAQQDVITTVVGNGPNGIPALNANIATPEQVAIDAQGNVYVATYQQQRVFEITTSGKIVLIAGNGVAGYSGDGGLATAASLNYPQGVAVDGANPANVYIADTYNCLVRKVTAATGIISTVVGLVTTPADGVPYTSCGFSGDGGAANAAEIYYPVGLALNLASNNLYLADYENGRVRKVAGGTAGGTITTIAGGGGDATTANNCQGSAPYGDGAAAGQSYLCDPAAVALDTSVSPANVFIADQSHCVVREIVGSSGKIYQIAGSYTLGCGYTDNVAAASGQLYYPQQLAVQVNGKTTTVTVADFYNFLIRQFTLTYTAGVPTPGNITSIAGVYESGYSGDGGPALTAGIGLPVGVVFDSAGDLYLAGEYDDRVRKVTKSTGDINTVAGWGNVSYSLPTGISGVPGGGVSLYQPSDVFADPLSTKLYIGGYGSQNDYLWDSSTTDVANFAGNGVSGYAGDGAAANAATTELDYPTGVVKDSSGNVFLADYSNCVVRKDDASDGKIHTVVGGTDGASNGCGYGGDGGPATAAQIDTADGLAIDAANNLYLADSSNCLIRRVSSSTGIITTVAGLVTTPSGGVPSAGNCGASSDGAKATSTTINPPTGVAVDGQGNLYIAQPNEARVRKVDAVSGLISAFAGDGVAGYSGDGVATQVYLDTPQRIAADVNGNVFIADFNNALLRWVDPAGQLTTFAGTPQTYGFGGDGGPALGALLSGPAGVSQDSAGNFYFADQTNQRVRKITAFAGYGRSTASLAFGDQATGTSSEYQPVYLSAIGPVTINSVTAPAGFAEIDDCAGTSLTTGQTCEIDVAFTPSKTGTTEGALSISSNAFLANQASTVALSGHGVGLTLTGSLAFGTNLIKTPVSKTVTLANSGSALTFGKIYLTEATDFSIASTTCPAAGATFATGASCAITVAFSAQTIGAKKSALVISSSDPTSPLLAAATGNGSAVELSTSTLAFPTANTGTLESLDLTVTNLGTNTLTLAPAISGTGAAAFAVLSTGNTCTSGVAAGKSCTLPVLFDPTSGGSFAATLTLTTNGGTNPVVALSGSSIAVTVSPASIAFPTIPAGTNEASLVTVNNLGSTPLTLATAFSGTGAAAYTIGTTKNTCGTSVAAKTSCSFYVKFTPSAAQTYSATLTLTTNGGANPAIALSGTGKAVVTATPTSITFTTITHGTNEASQVPVNNPLTTAITLSNAFSGTGASAYSIASNLNTCGSSVAPGSSCSFYVKFSPAAAQTYTATLTITTNGGTDPTVSLTGTGK